MIRTIPLDLVPHIENIKDEIDDDLLEPRRVSVRYSIGRAVNAVDFAVQSHKEYQQRLKSDKE